MNYMQTTYPLGSLVTVRAPYVGDGRYGHDAWTGKTLKVFGYGREDLLLGWPDHDEDEVAIHPDRCTPVK